MTSAPLIGVVARGRTDGGRYCAKAAYVDAIRRAGGEPLLFLPGAPDPSRLLRLVDAAVLLGGGDVDPKHFGGRGHPASGPPDEEQDASEIQIIRLLAAGRLPLLGICRGVQVMNVALGGTLHEHVADAFGETVPHRASPQGSVAHEVFVEADSLLARVLGTRRCSVSSSHHQALRDVAPGLSVTARAADGVIEAVEKAGHPWFIGVQWHPEVTAADDAVQQRLFNALVAAAEAGTVGPIE